MRPPCRTRAFRIVEVNEHHGHAVVTVDESEVERRLAGGGELRQHPL
jgi:hypothetical protein